MGALNKHCVYQIAMVLFIILNLIYVLKFEKNFSLIEVQ